jgi:hypothetical protein
LASSACTHNRSHVCVQAELKLRHRKELLGRDHGQAQSGQQQSAACDQDTLSMNGAHSSTLSVVTLTRLNQPASVNASHCAGLSAQAKGFSMMSLTWAFGAVAAPIVRTLPCQSHRGVLWITLASVYCAASVCFRVESSTTALLLYAAGLSSEVGTADLTLHLARWALRLALPRVATNAGPRTTESQV